MSTTDDRCREVLMEVMLRPELHEEIRPPSVMDGAERLSTLMARFDESVEQPGMVALRCTEHAAFVVWVHLPTPVGVVRCPRSCRNRS